LSETAAAYQWTVTAMQADTVLMAASPGGVWQGYAPIGTTPPFVQVSQQAGTDMLTMNAVRLFVHILLQIKAIGPAANYGALVIIADRIDTLFKSVRTVGLPSGGVLCCYREQSLAYDEIINGAQFSHLGGLYHIELQGV
jgi:hypothetical protein